MTFSVYTDGADRLLQDSGRFCEKLYGAMCSGRGGVIGHGGHVNLVTVQAAVRADGTALYVQSGNEVRELCAGDPRTTSFMQQHPDSFREALDFLRGQVAGLEEQFAAYQSGLQRPG